MDSKLPTQIDKHVSDRLRERRKKLGLTQEDLAQRIGVTFQQFQKYENGANRISAGRLFQLAVALETSIPFFYEGLQSVSRALLRGVSEEAAEFEGRPDDVETTDLVITFRSISDPAARRAVLALARKSAGGPDAGDPKRKRKRT